MLKEKLINELQTISTFFENSISCLTEDDSGYSPQEGLFTVAQQVAHTAQTVDWFFEGAFSPAGFNMEFDKLQEKVRKITSLTAARDWFKKSIADAVKVIKNSSEGDLKLEIAPGPIMGGMPRHIICNALSDHTAHHRGALTIYSRLLGKTPAMPYGDM